MKYQLSRDNLNALSKLEQGVIHYVASRFAEHSVTTAKRGIPYTDLERFIFSYYKRENPAVISNFIHKSIEEAQSARWRDESKKEWEAYFKALLKKSISEIEYEDAVPVAFRERISMYGGPQKIPIRRYTHNLVENLEMLGILKRPKKRNVGVRLKPQI